MNIKNLNYLSQRLYPGKNIKIIEIAIYVLSILTGLISVVNYLKFLDRDLPPKLPQKRSTIFSQYLNLTLLSLFIPAFFVFHSIALSIVFLISCLMISFFYLYEYLPQNAIQNLRKGLFELNQKESKYVSNFIKDEEELIAVYFLFVNPPNFYKYSLVYQGLKKQIEKDQQFKDIIINFIISKYNELIKEKGHMRSF
ncbi:MAG: hypothetical protein ACTSQE_12260 [Candidatus Heimdallarchaeaceae archaeon]